MVRKHKRGRQERGGKERGGKGRKGKEREGKGGRAPVVREDGGDSAGGMHLLGSSRRVQVPVVGLREEGEGGEHHPVVKEGG